MYEKDGKRYNCCESVLMFVNDEIPLDGFGRGVMRATSNMGGGGAGWGSLCGAVSGGVMAFGLHMGTNGDEDPEEFDAIRTKMREKTQVFLQTFEDRWGNVDCYDLLGANTRTPEGKKKYDENRAKGIYFCEDYVHWAAAEVKKLLKE